MTRKERRQKSRVALLARCEKDLYRIQNMLLEYTVSQERAAMSNSLVVARLFIQAQRHNPKWGE